MYVCMFGPESSVNIDEKCPNLQSTFRCNNSFLMFWMPLSFSTINIEVWNVCMAKNTPIFEMYVCMFGPKRMCFIEQIGFYIHGFTPLTVSKSRSCELFRLFVCLYVWMFGRQPGPGAPKRSVFMMVGHLRVPSHTKDQKTSPNGLQEYVFIEVLAGCYFEVFEAHPSIHTYIHPSLHPSIHTYIHT